MIGKDFNPKLGDFGMAKFFNHGQSDAIEELAGTFGYMDPFSKGIHSSKSDMYGFGVVLLVMANGRPALGEVKDVHGTVVERPHIKDFVSMEYKTGGFKAVADPRLEENFVQKEMHAMICIGLMCVSEDLEERPSAKKAIRWLKSARGNVPDPTDGRSPLNVIVGEASSGQSSVLVTISWIFVNLSWFFAFHDSSILIFYSMFNLFGCDR
jgi:serine/threonine protein kinase